MRGFSVDAAELVWKAMCPSDTRETAPQQFQGLRSEPLHPIVPANRKLPVAYSQGKDDGERRSSAVAGTRVVTRGRGGGVGGGRGGEEEPIEAELRLPEYGGPFSDYSEIVLQYGYITMFASALPIVTFFAIAEVLLQIRTDR